MFSWVSLVRRAGIHVIKLVCFSPVAQGLSQEPKKIKGKLFFLSYVCMSVSVQISPFYKDTSHIDLGPTFFTLFWLDYLYKDPISK